jgi:hypothetical protein
MDEDQQRNDDWQNESNPGDLFVPERDQEKLDEDGDRPAAPLQTADAKAEPQDYPTTDTDVDAGGAYYAGTADESGYTPNPEDDDNKPSPLNP